MLNRLAGIGAGATMLVGLVSGGLAGANAAGAATPKADVVRPSYIGCTFTISHPTPIYKKASFTGGTYGGGKHTGQVVTSEYSCAYFDAGFHSVRLSGGGTGYIYASDLSKPSPQPSVQSRYVITGSVNVRNAPSTTHGAVIATKSKGQVVTSPAYKNDFSNNGFAEVLMGNGNIGWISSAYVN